MFTAIIGITQSLHKLLHTVGILFDAANYIVSNYFNFKRLKRMFFGHKRFSIFISALSRLCKSSRPKVHITVVKRMACIVYYHLHLFHYTFLTTPNFLAFFITLLILFLSLHVSLPYQAVAEKHMMESTGD